MAYDDYRTAFLEGRDGKADIGRMWVFALRNSSGSISTSLGAPHFAQPQFQAHHVRFGS